MDLSKVVSTDKICITNMYFILFGNFLYKHSKGKTYINN